ncbi:MAG: RraA family protein, partial [Alphaproteobacteria bacterium]|nr:RraA family protein [Alphaproteobacteria bacterium]
VQDSVNEEIAFAGTQVHPGDLVVADGSGVIIVDRDRAEEVIAAGEEIAAREAAMSKAVRDGMSIVDVLEKGGYESMLNADGADKD